MDEKKKPVVPDVTYLNYDGLPKIALLSKKELSELLSENSGKVPIDASSGKPVMCYAVDMKNRWTGKDTPPVMCYAMPAPTTTGEKRKLPKIMCYKRVAPKSKKKDDDK